MSEFAHPGSGLTKSLWSTSDFDDMEWRNVVIHGFCVRPNISGGFLPCLLFDIDYIVGWVHPVPPEERFSFWMAPSTLVFEEVWDVEGSLEFKTSSMKLGIYDIGKSEVEGKSDDPLWHIDGDSFDLKFRSAGYRQYFRQEPHFSPRMVLSYEERGGISFAEAEFAPGGNL
ncbi:hypothetical protein [Kitasatospora sp. NPDC057223]|uniref:hypothetical protein n=1 Tax=Kitasatospora sp. NPDC057223 TaxID=3346055 RepID=UPI00363AB709